MLEEVVERRGWVTREHFLQIVGVTNLLPGPNSSETAIHLGYTQRGWRGALATGLAFLLPTFVLVVVLSRLYFRWGALPAVEPLFWGLKPVILAIILWAGWKLAKTAVTGPALLVLAGAGAAVSFLAGRWAVGAMVAGGAITWGWHRVTGRRLGGGEEGDAPGGDPEARGARPDGGPPDDSEEAGSLRALLPLPLAGILSSLGSLAGVFWLHLWIGAVLFGGGYVLVALLEPYAVGRYAWLTQAQFLDGVALTQAVPGPISTLSAFVGYAAGGVPGAVLGTAGIYLPAFVAVLLVAPHLDRLRRAVPVRAALDGVGAVVAGAILGVGATLLPPAVPDPLAGGLLLGGLAVLAAFRIPALWLVLAGLAAGGFRALLV